jgi:hypothetical protein
MAERQNRVKRLEKEQMEIEEDIHNLLGMEILRNLPVIRNPDHLARSVRNLYGHVCISCKFVPEL